MSDSHHATPPHFQSVIHNQPHIVQLTLHTLTILLIYAYVKEHLQIPVPVLFFFSYIGIWRWISNMIKIKHGISRLSYLLPALLFVLFTLLFEYVLKDQHGMHGGLDDSKYVVRHRKAFMLLLLSVFSFIYLTMLRIRRRMYQLQYHPEQEQGILMSIISTLSTPLTVCSGGACNSIYMSTVTSLLSSFSLPLTVVVPVLNIIAYALQLVGLVSLYSVNQFKYGPFWVYLMAMLCQVFLESWICGLVMLGAVVWNAKFNKFVFGKKKAQKVQSAI